MRPATFTWLAVVIGVACAAIEWLGIAGWIAAAVLAASVAMHVIGNALGTRLREAADRDLRRIRAGAAAASWAPRTARASLTHGPFGRGPSAGASCRRGSRAGVARLARREARTARYAREVTYLPARR